MLKAGSKAPKIELLDQDGKRTTLASFGKKKVLVYFYPKAEDRKSTRLNSSHSSVSRMPSSA